MKSRSMKGFKKFTTVYIAVVLAVLILLAGIVTFAEFTKSSRAKRVVASYDDNGVLFSSNYLVMNNTDPNTYPNRRTIYTSVASNSVGMDVTVCNFAQGNTTRYSEDNITYTLSAKLVKENGASFVDAAAGDVGSRTVTITYGETSKTLNASNLSDSFSAQTIENDGIHSHVYKVEMSEHFNAEGNNVFLYVRVEPSAGSKYSPIDSVFKTAVGSAHQTTTWNGSFNDYNASNNPAPSAFDGFNYIVSGSGKGTVKVSWKISELVLSDVFMKTEFNSPLTPTSETINAETWNYIEFQVDSDTRSRYDLQFFYANGNDCVAAESNAGTYIKLASAEGATQIAKLNGVNCYFRLATNEESALQHYTVTGDFASWDTVKNYVTFNFTPSAG